MIKAILLNSAASLNNYKEISNIPFVPGEDFRIVFQIQDSQLDIRKMLDAAATVEVKIANTDGTDLTKAGVLLDAGDRSIWYVDIEAAESEVLGGPNVQITVDELGDGTQISKTVIYNALNKVLISGDC